jgi:NAD(P)-dependent dehydrogenase (short-subunit alcohol dehydrogenase family)
VPIPVRLRAAPRAGPAARADQTDRDARRRYCAPVTTIWEITTEPECAHHGCESRIGKGSAIALAEAGFDVAIAARTVHEGEGRDEIEPDRTLAGSLDGTAEAVRATGQRVLPVPMDLLDRATWSAAVEQVLSEWSRVDVLVNNARHQRHDHKARFADLSIESLEIELDANLLAPVVLAKAVLPGMLERERGTIVNLTSDAGYRGPDAPADQGGWSTSYALAKGGLHRLAPMIAMELGDRGIRAFNLNPGFVVTEKNASWWRRSAWHPRRYHPAARPVIAWLASDLRPSDLNGRPSWRRPAPNVAPPDWRRRTPPRCRQLLEASVVRTRNER